MEIPAAPSALVARRREIVAALVIVGAALSFAGWGFVRQTEQRRIEATFQRRSSVHMRLARERLLLHQEVVRGLRAYFEHSDDVTLQEFSDYTRPLFERLPAARAFQWAPRVTREKRPAFEAARLAVGGAPGFHIWERDVPTQLGTAAIPARDRAEYWPITWVEPLAGNEPSLGFDLSASVVTRPILDAARATRHMQISPQVRLIRTTATDRGSGVIFITPVFHTDLPGAAPDGFAGFIQAIFSVDSLLKQVHAENPDDALDFAYYDDSAQFDHLKLLYARINGREYSGSRDAATSVIEAPRFPANPTDAMSETFDVGGRKWRIVVAPNPVWETRQRTLVPWLVLAVELGFVALAALFAHGLLSRTARIEREVKDRTAELLESRRRLASILSDMPGAAYRCAPTSPFAVEFVSEGIVDLCGYTAEDFVSGRAHWIERLRTEDLAECERRINEAIAKQGTFELEYRVRHADGSERHIWERGHAVYDASGRAIALEGLKVDATARKEAESRAREFDRQMVETQKLESLGVLAGGIAHDFNNLLTAILGNASLARQSLAATSPVHAQLQQIERASRRAADLCGQMLAYAGKSQLTTSRVNLSELVRDTTSLLQVSLPKSARLDLRLHSALPAVQADATQLRQIVMNLVMNAAESIVEGSGQVTLHTFATEMTRHQLRGAVERPDLPHGLYVGLEVTDTGVGMPAEMLARIFEPFFSTKFSGRGLGLSAVLGIVRSHHGALFVESQPGVGSTFRLLLPAAPAAAKTPPAPSPTPGAPGAANRPELRGTVLVVDDEMHVRDMTSLALQMAGLEAVEAPDGETALRLCREHSPAIDLILLDLTMPGLSGEETLRRLRMQGGQQKVILISGYSAIDTAKRCAQLGAVAFLQKPFEISALLAELKKHLAR
ncbi:MAG: CHASE domain-containing protein [Candidatus Didemnitutus sp.]|nr:CHASE domain-containing protein [Candidatus Didemnitutus sp.]